MIDERNVENAKNGNLPPCPDGKNYPMYEFFRRQERKEFSINLIELGRERADGILPNSAYDYPPWWVYDFKRGTHPHALAWLNAGWRVESLVGVGKRGVADKDKYAVFIPFDLPKSK